MAFPVSRTAVVNNSKGLHLRPAGLLAQLAGEFQAEVQITKDGLTVDAASILDLLTLVATCGSQVQVSATGDDAAPAVDQLRLREAQRDQARGRLWPARRRAPQQRQLRPRRDLTGARGKAP